MQRLGRNLGAYFGERIDIPAILRDVADAARTHGWISETFHRSGDLEWFALHRLPLTPHDCHPTARIYISTGIHGDEPAGPLAVLRLLRENRWPAHAEIFLVPCLNITGFAASRRENINGIDLNRDYLHPRTDEIRSHIAWLERQPAFDLSLCLHEDWEAGGFYIYELNPDDRPSLAEAMIQRIATMCPVDASETIDGWSAKHGIIRAHLDTRTRREWPEAFWLITHKTRLSYTLEAPSDFPLIARVNALVEGVHAATGN